MQKNINETVAFCLRGKIVKSSLLLIFSRIMKLITFLYVLSVTHLLFFDTTLITKLSLFENNYIAAIICFSLTVIGCTLLFCSVYINFLCKHYIISQLQPCENLHMSFGFICRLIGVKIAVFISKFIIMFVSLLPSATLAFIIYTELENGISKSAISVCVIACAVLLFAGLAVGLILCQRYYFAQYCTFLMPDESIFDAIRYSVYLMDYKCVKLLKLKINNIIYKTAGLIIPYFRVISDAREFFIITDKTVEYARKAHTQQKAVVFYF